MTSIHRRAGNIPGENVREGVMNPISRRNMLTAAAAGGLLTAATAAGAQSGESMPQPQRPGHGGTDPGPRHVVRDRQNPDPLMPPATDPRPLPTPPFSFAAPPLLWPPAPEPGARPMRPFSFAEGQGGGEWGGWPRQITVPGLGFPKILAGVNGRPTAGGVRELPGPKPGEGASMLYGTARITA